MLSYNFESIARKGSINFCLNSFPYNSNFSFISLLASLLKLATVSLFVSFLKSSKKDIDISYYNLKLEFLTNSFFCSSHYFYYLCCYFLQIYK